MARRERVERVRVAFRLPRFLVEAIDQMAQENYSDRSKQVQRLLEIGLTELNRSRDSSG